MSSVLGSRDDTEIPNSAFPAPGDGIVIAARFGQSQMVVNPGATVGVSNQSAGTLTLANGEVFKTIFDPVSQVVLYDLPANLSLHGSNNSQ